MQEIGFDFYSEMRGATTTTISKEVAEREWTERLNDRQRDWCRTQQLVRDAPEKFTEYDQEARADLLCGCVPHGGRQYYTMWCRLGMPPMNRKIYRRFQRRTMHEYDAELSEEEHAWWDRAATRSRTAMRYLESIRAVPPFRKRRNAVAHHEQRKRMAITVSPIDMLRCNETLHLPEEEEEQQETPTFVAWKPEPQPFTLDLELPPLELFPMLTDFAVQCN